MPSAAADRSSASVARSPQRLAAGRGFYVGMALVVALVVAIGFSRTVNEGLLHPPSPRPWILYVHAATFVTWVLLFIAQTTLVRLRRVAWHRRLGVGASVIGGFIPIIGIWTALVMTRLHRAQERIDGAAFLIIPFLDMLAFSVAFGLAIYWRRRPEFHRRSMLMATCGLTAAAFARFPGVGNNALYVGVDLLILAAVVRDWIATRRVHPVYLYGAPALVIAQATAMWIYLSAAPGWISIANQLLR